MCLEEMLQTDVLDGALFYGKTRRRESVEFTPELRMQVEEASREVMTLLMSTDLPPPTPGPKCRKCSLRSFCVPDKAGGRGVVSRYVKKALRGLEDEEI
jgi:CRISPR-associated exonuclease Cas4